MKLHNDIKTRYRESFVMTVCILLAGVIGCALFPFFDFEISVSNITRTFISVLYPIFVFVALFVSIKSLISLIKDYKSLKKGIYSELKGVVIGFKKNRDTETGEQYNNIPVIKDENGSKITLSVPVDLELGETYTFIYLKYTKIADIKHRLEL